MNQPQDHTEARAQPVVASGTWTAIILVTWSLTFLALVALTVSSRTIGRSVWWLGPGSSARPPWTIAVPIAISFVPLAVTYLRHRTAPMVSATAAVVLLLAALPDAWDRPVIAGAVALVAIMALVVSIAVIAGVRQYR